jgi:hypothetical protein
VLIVVAHLFLTAPFYLNVAQNHVSAIFYGACFPI